MTDRMRSSSRLTSPRFPLACVALAAALHVGSASAVEPFVPSLEHLSDLQALVGSLSAVVSWTRSPARRLMRFKALVDLFAARRCYFLDLGTPDETAALIEGTVREP